MRERIQVITDSIVGPTTARLETDFRIRAFVDHFSFTTQVIKVWARLDIVSTVSLTVLDARRARRGPETI